MFQINNWHYCFPFHNQFKLKNVSRINGVSRLESRKQAPQNCRSNLNKAFIDIKILHTVTDENCASVVKFWIFSFVISFRTNRDFLFVFIIIAVLLVVLYNFVYQRKIKCRLNFSFCPVFFLRFSLGLYVCVWFVNKFIAQTIFIF